MNHDTFDRRIDYIRISVTDRCNLRCLYCMPPEGITPISHLEILGYEEIARVVRAASGIGIRKVRLTGGEPLVRKGLDNLVSALSRIPGIQDLSMTTNGILLSRFAKPLKDAGLHRVNVSMDSLDPERYRTITRGGDIHKVWEGIEAAMDAGFRPLKINIVALKNFNANEIVPFVKLTLEWPIEVRFIEWMPIGSDLDWDKKAFLSSDRILDEIRKEYRLEPSASINGNGPARHYKIPGAKGVIGIISPVTQHFCAECNRLRLTADGKLRNCLFSEEETDLKTVLRSGASDESIKEVLLESIRSKPRSHHLAIDDERIKKCMRSMNSIGG